METLGGKRGGFGGPTSAIWIVLTYRSAVSVSATAPGWLRLAMAREKAGIVWSVCAVRYVGQRRRRVFVQPYESGYCLLEHKCRTP